MEAVEGNLVEVRPMFESCVTEPEGAACSEVTHSVKNPYWLGDQAVGTQVSGLLDGWTPAPSAYAIKARNTADVVAGVDFARKNNLRSRRQGRWAQLLRHIECPRLAPHLDARDEPGNAA